MSYILDALNKTEQAKRNNQAPKLDAVQIFPQREKRVSWWLILMIVAIMNVGALFYFMGFRQTAPTSSIVSGQSLMPSNEVITSPQPNPDPVRISALPLNIQRQIPDMTFTSHIYATDPTLRMVNINGQGYYEGDVVADGLKLVAITEDGVLLSFLHYRVALPVMQDWSFD